MAQGEAADVLPFSVTMLTSFGTVCESVAMLRVPLGLVVLYEISVYMIL